MPTSPDPPTPSESQDVVLRARAGDAKAKEELLANHLPALRGYVRLRLGKVLRSREESVDLVQSICGDLLEDFDGFEYRGPESFRRWLLRRAENKIRARGRFWSRAKRSPHNESAQLEVDELQEVASCLTPSRHASSREELERLEQAFQTLGEDDRRVILLARVAGLDHGTVAAEMDRSPTATRSLLSRALARLAAALE